MTETAEHYLKRELYDLVQKDGRIFEFLQAGSLDGLWFWDVERPNEEWMSVRLKEVFGYTDDEIPNTSAWWLENIFPEDLPIVLENFRLHCANANHPYDQIVRYRHKNGSTVWVRCRGIAIRDPSGKTIRMLGAHTDVTAVIRAEESKRQLAVESEKSARARLDHLLEGISDALVALDRNWCYTYVNAKAGQILGRRPEDLIGMQIWTEFPESAQRPLHEAYHRCMSERVPVEFEEYYQPHDRWYENRTHPSADGIVVFFRDVTDRKKSESMVSGQNQILQMVAQGELLPKTLDLLLRVIEGQSPDMVCSILLLDDDGIHVRHGAAPSLPAEFSRAIDGSPIGPNAGSCGTAAFRREPVFVADIANDPLWAEYKHLALPHGLKACWSTPIFDPQKRVLGTFAIYYRQPGLPNDRHRELIAFATHTAAICISRQRAESSLRLSEARYALAVRGTSDGLWDWNIRTADDYLSPRWKELLGFADDELPNKADSFFGRIHPEDVPHALAAVRAHLEKRAPYDVELRLRTKSGEYRNFQSRGQAEWDDHGHPIRMAGSITDITERKKAKQALRDAAEFNLQIIACADDGIVVLDRELRYTVWNHFMERLMGLKAEDVLGRTPEELFPWVRRGGQLAAMHRVLAGESVMLPDSMRIKSSSRQLYWVQARLSALRNAQGEIIGVIATIIDVTERKQAEQELRRSHEQLRALTARLQSVREEQSAHIAREIHDVLGQQLTALKLDLMWLKRRVGTINDPVLQTSLTNKLLASAGLVDTTIHTVQRVATELRPGLLDKLGLAAALEHEARDFAERSGLRCELDIERDLIPLEPKRAIDIFRVCQEMLTNIARHAQASQIKVKLVRDHDRLLLEVSDNGRGISDQQLVAAKSLGLLGMKERAQILGGTLELRGSPGNGTTALLAVPIAPPP